MAAVVAAAVGGGGAAVAAAAGSVGGGEELGLEAPYGESGWPFHWPAYSPGSTETRIVTACSRRPRCCRATGSGSDFWNNLLHTCRWPMLPRRLKFLPCLRCFPFYCCSGWTIHRCWTGFLNSEKVCHRHPKRHG